MQKEKGPEYLGNDRVTSTYRRDKRSQRAGSSSSSMELTESSEMSNEKLRQRLHEWRKMYEDTSICERNANAMRRLLHVIES